jgi:predicted transposase/invertase (TIGR01784 family)
MLAEYEEMARRDEADRQKGAYSKGLQEGLQEGLREGELKGWQEGVYSVAQNLLRKKMSLDDIVETTGLSLEEVKRLSAKLS